ncbi:alpha/beta hydrolase family protein [Siminovitchia sediminis]|uniref:Alpha/beta hydrolase family protein n=1 Tax=Siminovitchia sediminis TaxID=1274353 RepID=A0ABW4KHM9_9BACI
MDQINILDKFQFPSPNPHIRMFLITYVSSGLRVKGLLAEPVQEGEYEGILYLRGGIKSVGMVRPARIAQFASEGFIVFAPFYRGNRGGEGNEDFAGEDRKDAFSAFRLLREHPSVLDNRIHIFGFSRGGVMALLTGIQFKEAASLVTWGGVSDMVLTYVERKDLRRMMKRVIGGSPKTAFDQYKFRTPLYDLEKLQIPVLIIHGRKDQNVSVDHAYRLEKRLLSLQKPVETWYFEHVSHYFPPELNRKVVHDMCTWMRKTGKK